MAEPKPLGAHEMGDLSIQFKANMSCSGAWYAIGRERLPRNEVFDF